MLPVTERFVSINGEGTHAGCFSAFVRLRGCNLACDYCDTRWSCADDAPAEELSVGELVAWALAQQVPCATITGGEPLLHPEVPQLVAALAEAGLFVEVETNGSCEIDALLPLDCCITADCKLPSSGMGSHRLPGLFERLRPQDCLKFVVGSTEDLDFAADLLRLFRLRCTVLFSPVWGQMEPATIVGYLREHGLTKARVQLQLHKIIWPGVEKGV